MEHNENLDPVNEDANPQEDSGNRIRIILIILLLISLIGNFFFMYDRGQVQEVHEEEIDTLTVEKKEVERRFEHAKNELSQFRNKYVQLDSLLDEAEIQLAERKEAIMELMKKNNKTAEDNQRLRAELADLKEEKQAIYDQIIKLLAENKNLRSVNDSLTTELANTEEVVNQQKTQIDRGARLVVDRVAVNHFKKRLIGGYAPTFEARKTDKSRICFDVLNNKLAKNGVRIVSIRLLTPEGQVLAGTSQGQFKDKSTGKNKLATFNYKLDYDGGTAYICQEWEDESVELQAGKYTVEVYIDGEKAFSSPYELD